MTPVRVGGESPTTTEGDRTTTLADRVRRSVEAVIRARRVEGPMTRLLASLLLAASWLFGLVARLRAFLYARGILSSGSLPSRVVSVGNLTVGGSGKTPMVLHLARRCSDLGLRAVVLSRGYRGTHEKTGMIVSDGERMVASARAAGDEPYMIAKSLPRTPVIVGRDRVEMGGVACRRFAPDLVLLDDGFQHLRLRRDRDILLVDGSDGFGNGRLLPRGPLREPLTALRRADVVVITKIRDRRAVRPLETQIRKIRPDVEILHASFRPDTLVDLADGACRNLDALEGQSVIAVSGIVNPGYFEYLLSMTGANVTGRLEQPDHHAYTEADLRSLMALTGRGAWIVTTEKDAAKMEGPSWKPGEIFALRVAMEIEEGERLDALLTEARGPLEGEVDP